MLDTFAHRSSPKLALVITGLVIASSLGAVLIPPEPEVDALKKAVAAGRSPQAACDLLLSVLSDRGRGDAVRLEAMRLLIPIASLEYAKAIAEVALRKGDAPHVRSAALIGAWQLAFRDYDGKTKSLRLREVVRGEYSGELPMDREVRTWAANELCEMAVVESFKEIRDHLVNHSGVADPIGLARFCKDRMDVISSTSTLEAAYIKALLVPSHDTKRRLGWWAFEHLEEINSKTVDEAFIKAALLEVEQNQRVLYDPIYWELERRGWKREQLHERGLTWPPAIF